MRGAIFDLDGTLFDADYDWPAIRRRLGMAADQGPILHYLESLPQEERQSKTRLLEQIERLATDQGRLRPGARRLLGGLRARGVKLALVTNNSRRNASDVLRRYCLRFDSVLTRDSGPTKPSGAPMLQAAELLGLALSELVVVGDSRFDVEAARDAGVERVFLVAPAEIENLPASVRIAADLLEMETMLSEELRVD